MSVRGGGGGGGGGGGVGGQGQIVLMFCSIDSLDFSFKKWWCYHVATLGYWLNGLYTT